MLDSTQNDSDSSVPSGSRAAALQSLKRNQACHQCRRRKLKCDAKRPACSTCIRSHKHSIAHAPPGSSIPTQPNCTYDEVVKLPENRITVSKHQYEAFEKRINELEARLREKEEEASVAWQTAQLVTNRSAELDQPPALVLPPTAPTPEGTTSRFDQLNLGGAGSHQTTLDPSGNIHANLFSSDDSSFSTPLGFGSDLTRSDFYPLLPKKPIVLHLVDAFFKFHPHAHKLFHRPSFLTSLSLPTNHSRYPRPALLHAICAIGSLYTAAVTLPSHPTSDRQPGGDILATAHGPLDELFLDRQRLKEARNDTFAEQQAKYAKEMMEQQTALGVDLFQAFQACIVLIWFHWPQGRWADVFFFTAFAMRTAVPLGLNLCPPLHSIGISDLPHALLPPAQTVIEDETRRNAFWLVYATERLSNFGSPWVHSLDDQDISQLLPVRGQEFDIGHLVLSQDRQWAHTRNVLVENPEDITDSFTLYIKGAMLISRVKTFNARYRIRLFSMNAELNDSDNSDPRHTQAFNELENTINTFVSTFPTQYKMPIDDNSVDNHLYSASLTPHIASILLHEPHADVHRSGCSSALTVMMAARSILDLIYRVCSTSFDISLLDPFCSYAWYWAGRVLVRFLHAAEDANNHETHGTLQAEVEFIRSALIKQGKRYPSAARYARMLFDYILTRKEH